jgi:hypothetical protein
VWSEGERVKAVPQLRQECNIYRNSALGFF